MPDHLPDLYSLAGAALLGTSIYVIATTPPEAGRTTGLILCLGGLLMLGYGFSGTIARRLSAFS